MGGVEVVTEASGPGGVGPNAPSWIPYIPSLPPSLHVLALKTGNVEDLRTTWAVQKQTLINLDVICPNHKLKVAV